jgi:spore maturation protein SpmB
MKKSLIDVFVEGARKGLQINFNSIIPNLIMAFVLIQALKITGILAFLGNAFAPIMAVFGLPGEGITVLLSAWLSMGGGVGACASLYAEGILTGTHVSILIPAIFLMGAQAQYMGRCLGTAGVQGKYYAPLLGIAIVNALLAMLVMRFLV